MASRLTDHLTHLSLIHFLLIAIWPVLVAQSHEIRTPMNAVLGVGRLLADTPLSLEQQQLVAMITNSGQLLLTIINDILDYSKIEVRSSTSSRTRALAPIELARTWCMGQMSPLSGMPLLRCSPFVFFESSLFIHR
jgi:signal transduction histidine kinase